MSVAHLEKTFVQNALRAAQRELGLTDAEIGGVVGAHRRTIQRWKHDAQALPSPAHREQMEQITELLYLLRSTFRTMDVAREWLHSPVPLLRGRTPISLLRKGEIEEVISVLAGLNSGKFI